MGFSRSWRTIIATDSDKNTASKDLKVTVTDVHEFVSGEFSFDGVTYKTVHSLSAPVKVGVGLVNASFSATLATAMRLILKLALDWKLIISLISLMLCNNLTNGCNQWQNCN
jgi:hypothetical protein